jgi:DNA polymerase-3 subunit delta
MIYLLRDDLIGEERLAAVREGLGAPDLQSLNTTILDGQRLSLAELRSATEALPFLGNRRLVVVRRLFGTTSRTETSGDTAPSRRSSRTDDREQEFLSYFPSLPPTTDLVLIEDRDFRPDHPAAKLIAKLGGEVNLSGMPRWDQLTRWIEQRVRQKGAQIERDAAQDLSSFPMADLRQLDLTLDHQ